MDKIIKKIDNNIKETKNSLNTKIPKEKKKTSKKNIMPLKNEVVNPLWLSVSEAAKLGGVTGKTVRRALQAKKLKYKIVKNRYTIDLRSILKLLFAKKKLENKLNQDGIGQYIDKWKE